MPSTLGDPDWEARQFDSQAMVPSAYAEKTLEEVMRSARTKLEDYGSVMTPSERDAVLRISETGEQAKSNWFMNLLNIIDTPAEMLRLGIADIGGADTQRGIEIRGSDYWNALTGKEALVRERLGELSGGTDAGQFLVPGSQLIQSMGVENKVAKGVGGFLLDVVLDPLNAVSFGTLGLGKKIAVEGAQAALGTAAKNAARAIADNAVDSLVGLERRVADRMLTRADEAEGAIYDTFRRQIEKGADEGTEWADEELLAQLRTAARESAIDAETRMARIGAGEDLPDIHDLVKSAYADTGLTHAAGDVTNEITSLVANKQFGTLEDVWDDFIKYQHTPHVSTGGMKIVAPFFRKQFPAGIDIGMRNDISVRAGIDKILEKLPGKAGETANALISRFDKYYGETMGAMRGQAWTLRTAKNLGENLRIEPTASLRAAVTDIHATAAASNIDVPTINKSIARALEASDPLETVGGLPPSLAEKLVTNVRIVKGVLRTLREAAEDSGMEIGNIDNYFPMLASKEFRDTVELLAVKGTKVEWEHITDPQARMGMQLLSELVGAAGQARKRATIDQGSSRFVQQRTISRHVFNLHGTNIEMADLQNGAWAEWLAGVNEGYLTHEALNKALSAALGVLADQGKVTRKITKVTPYSEDIGEVLDTYVSSITQAINFRHQAREMKRLGLLKPVSRRIHAGDTLAETLLGVGPTGRNIIEEIIELGGKVAEYKAEKASKLTTIAISRGVTVEVPSVVVEDVRFDAAIKRLRDRLETADRHIGDSRVRTAKKAADLERIGVPKQLAEAMTTALTDEDMGLAIDEIMLIGQEQANYIVAGVAEMLATAADTFDLEQSERIMKAAIRQAERIITRTEKSVREMRRTWNKKFQRTVFEEIPMGNMDLLGLSDDGSPWLARIASEVGETIVQERDEVRRAAMRAAGEKARDLMAMKYADRGTTLGKLIEDWPVSRIEKLWQIFKLKGHFTDVDSEVLHLKVADFVQRMEMDNIWQIDPHHPHIDDVLWHLWRDSWKGGILKTPDVLDNHAAQGLFRMRDALTGSFKADEIYGKAHTALTAMRSGDVALLTNRANRRAFLFVLERFGINTDYVHFPPEGGIVWRPNAFEEFHDKVDVEEVMGLLRGITPGGDSMTRPELLASVKAMSEDELMAVDPKIRLFVDMLNPDGSMVKEIEQYQHMKDLVRDLALWDVAFTKSVRVTSRMLENKNDLNKGLTTVLHEIDKVMKGGAAGPLTRAWRTHGERLRGLMDSEYDELNHLVEYMKGTARLGGPGKRIVERNLAEASKIYRGVDKAYDQFDTWANETVDALRQQVGQEYQDAADVLRTFQAALVRIFDDFGPNPGAEIATVFEGSFDEAFKLVRGLGKEAARATETIREGARGFGRINMPKAGVSRAELGEAAEAFGNLRATKVMTAEAGGVSPAIAGLAGEVLEGYVGDAHVIQIIENMAKEIRSISTPYGLRAIAEEAGAFVKWWKGAATVARPTFIPRNILGGIFNGRIIGVGINNYRHAFGTVNKMVKLMERSGLTPEQALAQMNPNDAAWLTGLFDSELLLGTFGSSLRHITVGETPKPWRVDKGLFRVGGLLMERSENWMRAAAFHRHYDPLRPETMEYAKALVNTVHFDYQALTSAERSIAKVIPFFVWTRRNIPLQVRVMLENPGFVNRYQHLITEANEFFDGEETVADDFPTSPYQSGLSVFTDIILGEDTPFWSRLIFAPEVPLNDLEDAMRAFGPGQATAFNYVLGMIHPGAGMLVGGEMRADYPDVNAPRGLREILMTMPNVFGLVETETDIRVPYNVASGFNTLIPFLNEWGTLAGARPSDPRAQARLGYQEGGEPGLADSLRGAGIAGARFAGASLQTPGDTLGPASQSRDFLTELIARMRLEGRIPQQ